MAEVKDSKADNRSFDVKRAALKSVAAPIPGGTAVVEEVLDQQVVEDETKNEETK